MESEGTGQRNPKLNLNPSLPQEIINEILVRLPVKYLLRFKCVSKQWLALISSPQFVSTHLTFSAKDYTRHSLLLCFWERFKYCSVSSLFNESVSEAFDLNKPMGNNFSTTILGSVNGLICLKVAEKLILWNPSIRKFKQVVDVTGPKQVYGFGYDEVHDDYKIVSLSSPSYYAWIYSCKNDSWRKLNDFQIKSHFYGTAMLVNGKLHWLTHHGDYDFFITSLDLVDEKWGEVEQPSYGGRRCHGFKLGLLGSDLCVFYSCYYDNNVDVRKHTDVWIMKEYGVKESWTKLHSITYPIECFKYEFLTPLYMSNEREFLLLFESGFMIYNAEDQSIKHREVTDVTDEILGVELYIESLVSPIIPN